MWEYKNITENSTNVSLHNLMTDTELVVNTSTTVLLCNCSMSGYTSIIVHRSQSDVPLKAEKVTDFPQYDSDFDNLVEGLGSITFTNCHFSYWISLELMDADKIVNFVDCSVAFLTIKCANTLKNLETTGITGVRITESQFIDGMSVESVEGHMMFIEIRGTFCEQAGVTLSAPLYKFEVHNSVFFVVQTGLDLISRRKSWVSLKNCRFYFVQSTQSLILQERAMLKVGMPRSGIFVLGQMLLMMNVTFQVNLHDAVYGDILSFPSYCSLFLSNVTFILHQFSAPLTFKSLLSVGTFSDVWFESVMIDSTKAMFNLELLTLSKPSTVSTTNLTFFCSAAFSVVQHTKMTGIGTSGLFYKAIHFCKQGEYSFQRGLSVIEGLFNASSDNVSKLIADTQHPHCLSCPVGAQCEGDVKASPNYWGHKNSRGVVNMIRCPENYCCSNKETCDSIDSCNVGRTATLCGKCDRNTVESLVTVQCVPSEHCSSSLVISVYYCLSFTIAITLTFGEIMKNLVWETCSILCTKFTSKPHKANGHKTVAETTIDINDKLSSISNQGSHQNEPEQESTCSRNTTGSRTEEVQPADAKREESGMKYIQILLYYVQDGSLFKAEVPSQDTPGTSALQLILQFSPDIVGLVYTNIASMCIPNSTAITKVIFQAALGPCVLSSVFLIYLIQRFVSKFMRQKSILWRSIRCSLMKAFVMTLLFSYQKIVTGIFTLVQCVEVDQSNVLYVYGELQCYTWWQHLLHIYIFLSVIPLFLVISYLPFKVQDGTVSLKFFVLSCMFPVPIILLHCIQQFLFAKNADESLQHSFCRKSAKSGGIEIKSSSESPKRLHQETTFVATHTDTVESTLEATKLDIDSEEEEEAKGRKEVCDTNPEEVVLDSLLKHYRCLNVCGMKFTWLAFHKLYRLTLVVCKTYIAEPVVRLLSMSAILILFSVASNLVNPYKENTANVTAKLSYAACFVVAVLNLAKSGLATFGCDVNCSLRDQLLPLLNYVEKVLLVYVPMAAMLIWALGTRLQKLYKFCQKKLKKDSDKEE